MNKKIIKLFRYSKIYGISRALIKVASRTRIKFFLPNFKRKRFISLIGCGQFGFSTISYFLYFNGKSNFLDCYDTNLYNSKSLCHFFGFQKVIKNIDDLFLNKKCKLVYIASNHNSHTEYAIKALTNNIDVYIEKPISVSNIQFNLLLKAYKSSSSNIYVGYNRPFSGAIKKLSPYFSDNPFSINCFISGHLIEKDHWYRDSNEGTRICGNMGHWIDLSIHLFNTRGSIPSKYNISISQANALEPDDNLVVSISTDRNDIVSIMLSARSEPFEGINETINILNGELIAKIDDFRSLSIWKNETFKKVKFSPKDVGHKSAILQPFTDKKRKIEEVLVSTKLMLEIKNMIIEKRLNKTIKINEI